MTGLLTRYSYDILRRGRVARAVLPKFTCKNAMCNGNVPSEVVDILNLSA